jgi:hypothetical protein
MVPFDRPPSSAWEQVQLSGEPGHFLWVWFSPAMAPQSVLVQVPVELLHESTRRTPLTMRSLAHSVGIDPRTVARISLYGTYFDAPHAIGPLWDNPIPTQPPGADPTIALFMAPAVPPAPPATQAPATGLKPAPAGNSAVECLSRIDAAWNASLQLELQLAAAAKQLNGTLARINSLNRDLSSEEARCGDNQDKREWSDARRWLRDGAARLSRFLKDHHIGMTSAAGKRNTYESIHKQYVVSRTNFEGSDQMEREFESYRKQLQSLLNNMNSALGAAVQEGERRAQQILARISAKVRAARTKR